MWAPVYVVPTCVGYIVTPLPPKPGCRACCCTADGIVRSASLHKPIFLPVAMIYNKVSRMMWRACL